MNDAKTLFLRHRSGDPAALPLLVERLSPSLRRLALRMKLEPHAADDAVQETWLAVLSSAASFDETRPFQPWLHALLRHSAANQRRREHRMLRALTMLATEPAQGTDADSAARAEAATCLRAALGDLPSGLRRPLTLHLLEGLEPKAIAARLGVSQGSVRVMLFRGRRALRRQLPPVLGIAGLLSLDDPRPRGSRIASRATFAAAAALVVCALPTAAMLWSHETAAPVQVAALAATRSPVAASNDAPAEPRILREAAAPQRTLAITVRDDAGRSVPAVAVTVEPRDGTDPRLHRRTDITDERGVVRFANAAEIPLAVFSDRGATTTVAAGAERADLFVRSSRDVVVHAVDDIGERVADAGIWLGTADDGHGAVVARTDDHGTCTLRAVTRDTTIALLADGHRRTTRVPIGDRDEVTLRTIADTEEVVLRVLDAAGAPLAGAKVFGGNCGDGVPPRVPTDVVPLLAPAIRVATDIGGEARLASLEPGTHPVVVRAPGHAPLVLDLSFGTGGQRLVTCRLDAAPPVCGRAADATGRGIANARIVLHSEHRSGDIELTTAADGTFAAEAAPIAIDEIIAGASDTEVVHVRLGARAPSTPLAIVMPSLPQWRGRLVDENGRPFADHELRFASTEQRTARPDRVVRTAADGTFAIVAPGNAYCRIGLRGTDWPFTMDVPSACVTRQGTNLEIAVPRASLPSGRLRGRLLDEDGVPVQNRRLGGVLHGLRGESLPKAEIGCTDAAGRFDIGPLPPGQCMLVLDASNDDSVAGIVGAYSVPEAGVEEVEVVLPHAQQIAGDFEFDDGTRPATALALLQLPGSDLTITTQPGRLRQRLLPGHYSLSIAGEGFAWINDTRVVMTDVDLHAKFTLERATTVRLQPGTLPAGCHAGAGLWIRATDGSFPGRTLCRFDLEPGGDCAHWLAVDLPPGSYVAEVQRLSGEIATAPFHVDDRQPTRDLRLRFDP